MQVLSSFTYGDVCCHAYLFSAVQQVISLFDYVAKEILLVSRNR